MCDETNSISKNSINSILWCSHDDWKDCFVVFTASRSEFVILCSKFMLVQTSKGNV